MTVYVRSGAIRCALGDTPSAVYDAWMRQERGLAPIAHYPCPVAATIEGAPAVPRSQRHLRRMGVLALAAGQEAFTTKEQPERLGLYAAYGGLRAHWEDLMPAMARQESDRRAPWANGLGTLHPFWMLKHLSNNTHALLAEAIDAQGDGATFGGANAGAQAIEAACAALEAGVIDTALVIACDSLIEPETLIDLGVAGALAKDVDAPPAYDPRARGFVPGEAAAAIVLSRTGPGPVIEAFTGADGAKGEPGAEALKNIVDRAGPFVRVDGASRAQPHLDAEERAIVGDVPMSSLQSALGQLGGAASVVQAIMLAEACKRGVSGPMLALATGAPGLVGAVRLKGSP
jgi:3-oxoacyl-(acyl-carrier-protein) synthase